MSAPNYILGLTADGIPRDAIDARDAIPTEDAPTGHPVSEDPWCGQRCTGHVCGGERLCAEYGPEPVPACGAHFPICGECADDLHCRECDRERREAAS